MSNFKIGDEVSWFVNKGKPIQRIIKGKIIKINNKTVSVTNYHSLNNNPYGESTKNKYGINTINIKKNNIIQNDAVYGLANMFEQANTSHKKHLQNVEKNKYGINNIPEMFNNSKYNKDVSPSLIRNYRPLLYSPLNPLHKKPLKIQPLYSTWV
jgi:hypothetical protein